MLENKVARFRKISTVTKKTGPTEKKGSRKNPKNPSATHQSFGQIRKNLAEIKNIYDLENIVGMKKIYPYSENLANDSLIIFRTRKIWQLTPKSDGRDQET